MVAQDFCDIMRGWIWRGRAAPTFWFDFRWLLMSFFFSDAFAQESAAAPQGDPIMGLLFPIGLVVILYFFMIRPQIKRQKEHKKLVEGLAKGDEVATMGGIVGKVTDLGDNFAKLEVAEGIEIKIRRQAVESVLPKGSLKEL